MTSTLKALNRISDQVGRSDLYTVHPDLLEIEPGYNIRGYGHDSYWESETAQRRIRGIADSYKADRHVDPPIVEVVDGKVFVRNGEHRVRAIRLARSEGWDCERVRVIQMDNISEEQRKLILLTGNAGAPTTPIEQGAVYRELREQFNMSDIEIAKRVGRTREHVRMCRAYTAMPAELIAMVQQEKLTVKKAFALFRKHGDRATLMAKNPPAKKPTLTPAQKVDQVLERFTQAHGSDELLRAEYVHTWLMNEFKEVFK